MPTTASRVVSCRGFASARWADRVTPAHTLIIGCGNILRGDDAVGPVLVRHLWERGLPDGVICADGGTGGMDVAFKMRGMRHVILVDACATGATPGTLYRVPGEALEELPPLDGINLHAFKWNHALAFARWLLKDDYPQDVAVYLIEAATLDSGRLCRRRSTRPCVGWSSTSPLAQPSEATMEVHLTEQGHLHLPADVARRFPTTCWRRCFAPARCGADADPRRRVGRADLAAQPRGRPKRPRLAPAAAAGADSPRPAFWDDARGAAGGTLVGDGRVDEALGVESEVVAEDGRWVVYLVITMWNPRTGEQPLERIRRRSVTTPRPPMPRWRAWMQRAAAGAADAAPRTLMPEMTTVTLRPQPVGLNPAPRACC